MLLAFYPVSFIYFPVWILELAKARLLIIDVVAIILASIRPRKLAVAVDLIIFPFASIYALVATDKHSFSFHYVINPVSFVCWPINEVLLTLALLNSLIPLSLILIASSIPLFAVSMLLAILPFALVFYSITPYLCALSVLNFNSFDGGLSFSVVLTIHCLAIDGDLLKDLLLLGKHFRRWWCNLFLLFVCL